MPEPRLDRPVSALPGGDSREEFVDERPESMRTAYKPPHFLTAPAVQQDGTARRHSCHCVNAHGEADGPAVGRRQVRRGRADAEEARLHYPEQFGRKQHSIVQRLLKALRKKVAENLIAQEPPCSAMTIAPLPEAVDGSGYARPDPPTAPPVEQALEVGRRSGSFHAGSSAPTAPPG
jgi:hypothetical protein